MTYKQTPRQGPRPRPANDLEPLSLGESQMTSTQNNGAIPRSLFTSSQSEDGTVNAAAQARHQQTLRDNHAAAQARLEMMKVLAVLSMIAKLNQQQQQLPQAANSIAAPIHNVPQNIHDNLASNASSPVAVSTIPTALIGIVIVIGCFGNIVLGWFHIFVSAPSPLPRQFTADCSTASSPSSASVYQLDYAEAQAIADATAMTKRVLDWLRNTESVSSPLSRQSPANSSIASPSSASFHQSPRSSTPSITSSLFQTEGFQVDRNTTPLTGLQILLSSTDNLVTGDTLNTSQQQQQQYHHQHGPEVTITPEMHREIMEQDERHFRGQAASLPIAGIADQNDRLTFETVAVAMEEMEMANIFWMFHLHYELQNMETEGS